MSRCYDKQNKALSESRTISLKFLPLSVSLLPPHPFFLLQSPDSISVISVCCLVLQHLHTKAAMNTLQPGDGWFIQLSWSGVALATLMES